MKKILYVFLSYTFRPKQQAYEKSHIEAILEEACVTAQADLRREHPSIKIASNYAFVEYGGSLNQELRKKLTESDICVVDISDNNPNVFYELGILHGLGKQPIILKSKNAQEEFKIPSDIQELYRLDYDEISDICGRLARAIVSAARELLSKPQISCLPSLWNFSSTCAPRIIYIVGPPSETKTIFSTIRSSDFVYLDRLGDKDALAEVLILLGRLYPGAVLQRYTSKEFPRQSYSGNIVSIGGPGSGRSGNSVTRYFMKNAGIPVHYSMDCKRLINQEGIEYSATTKHGMVIEDFGLFARAINPLTPDKRIILINGIHTFGVIGAVHAFSDCIPAIRNLELVLEVCGNDPLFFAYFPVKVINGVVEIPKLQHKNIFPL